MLIKITYLHKIQYTIFTNSRLKEYFLYYYFIINIILYLISCNRIINYYVLNNYLL